MFTFIALTKTRLGLTGEYDDPRTAAYEYLAWLQRAGHTTELISLPGNRYVVKAPGVATQAFVPIGDVGKLKRERENHEPYTAFYPGTGVVLGGDHPSVDDVHPTGDLSVVSGGLNHA